MNPNMIVSRQLEVLHEMELWLRGHEEVREELNSAIFGIANKMSIHPHDLAIYLIIRTASI